MNIVISAANTGACIQQCYKGNVYSSNLFTLVNFKGRVNDVKPVYSSYHEHILLGAHAVHFSEDLVDHSVRSPTWGRQGTVSSHD